MFKKKERKEMHVAALPDFLASGLRIQTNSLAREHYVFT